MSGRGDGFLRRIGRGAILLIACAAWSLFATGARAQAVSLTVHFKLTDPDYKPLANVPFRITFRSDPKWQEPAAGTSGETDANGEARFTATVLLEKVKKRIPTNFVSSLIAPPQPADRLVPMVELEYAGHRWLYAVELFRFEGGDVLNDGLTIYTPDSKGRFSGQAKSDNGGWTMPELGGLVLTAAPCDAWNYLLEPDPSDAKKWTLTLSFFRRAEPVRR